MPAGRCWASRSPTRRARPCRAEHVRAADALSYVAGYTVGQDISERILQSAATPPQFSLGKSLPGFGLVGPWLVTLDELDDPNDLELGCVINGEQMQRGRGRTGDLIFPVPALIEKLSATLPLLPGDVIFTGTPSGIGLGRVPPRWLAPGRICREFAQQVRSKKWQAIQVAAGGHRAPGMHRSPRPLLSRR